MKKMLKTCSIFSFSAGITAGVLISSAVGQGGLGSLAFPDVPSGSYYDEAIGEMASLGIITGFGDGTFKPNDPLTRGQAAVLLKRIRDEIKGIRSSSSSSSSRVSSVASSATSSASSSSSSNGSIPSAGLVRFTTAEYRVNEEDGSVTITLVRAGGNRGQVNVDYTLVAETALEDVDFAKQEGTVTFDSGSTSVKFDITIKNNAAQDGDKTFKILLGTVTGGAGKTYPEEATVFINDDETTDSSSSTAASSSTGPEQGTVSFSATEYAVAETEGTIAIRVQRTGGSKGSITVTYSMADGTAKSGEYDKQNGTLTFADGVTEQTITVTVHKNNSITGNKTALLSLGTVTGGAVLADKTATLTMYDAEIGSYGTGSLKLSDSEYEALESDGEAVITVRRVGGAKGQVNVKYLTIAGTATAGSDYKDVNNVLIFKHGEASKVFRIPVYADLASDGGETVNVRIQDATNGASITSPSFATLYIY